MVTKPIPLTQIAWKNVARKMVRNLVLVLAVTGLVSLLVFALLFKQTITHDIDTATKRLGADIVIVPPEAQSSAEEFILESREKTFYMDQFVADVLGDLEEVEQINSHTYLQTLEAGCCSIDEGQVIVYDSKNDFVVNPWLGEGSRPTLGKNEILVGSYVHEYLGLIDTAALFGHGVKVVGHLQETGTGLDNGIFIDQSAFAEISEEMLGDYKKGTLSIIFLKLKPGVEPDDLVAKIRNINPLVGIMTRGEIGSEVRSTLNDIVRIFAITIGISAALAILLSWSTFTAIANERRREVGILRAIGARKMQIVQLFITEAFIIAIVGGLLGVVGGHYLLHYLAADFHLISKLGAESALTLTGIGLSIIALLAGTCVCLIGALIPIVRLSSLEPLLAIQQE